MSSFYYYVGGQRQKPNDEQLQAWRLEHLGPADELAFNHPTHGPDGGGQGVIFGRANVIRHDAAKQQWRDYGPFWLGREKDNPPRPEDLQRAEMLSGHEVTMANGTIWRVPVQRFLPRRLRLDLDGNATYEPLPQFEQIAELAGRCWDDYFAAMQQQSAGGAAPEPSLSEQEQNQLAVGALAINYRVGMAEVDALGLLSDLSRLRTLEAIMDIPRLIAMGKDEDKKKAEAG